MNVKTINTTALLLQLKQIKDLENRLRERKKELEAQVFTQFRDRTAVRRCRWNSRTSQLN